MASPKGSVKLSDGKEVEIDVSTLKVKEWRAFWNPTSSDDDDDKVIARLTGLTIDDLQEMTRDDYRRIFEKVKELSSRPLDDPKN